MDVIILAEWIRGANMSADIFTKNLASPLFEKHMRVFVGINKYMKGDNSQLTLKGRVLDSD